MTDRIEKALRKLPSKERKKLAELIGLILCGKVNGLDVKKLQGKDDIYRVRKGDMRIIFQKTADDIRILIVERRSDTTYHEF